MSNAPPKRSLSGSSRRAEEDFNWPPTEEELSQFQPETVRSWPGRQDDFNWPPTDDELAKFRLDTPETSSMPDDSVQIASGDHDTVIFNRYDLAPPPAASPEPLYPAFDYPRGNEGSTPMDAGDPTPHGIESPTTSGIAVAHRQIALDETSASEWAAEISRLQALIEGLTQKVESRN